MLKEINKTIEEFAEYSNRIIGEIDEEISVKKNEIEDLERKKKYFFQTQSLVSKFAQSIPDSFKEAFFDTFMINKE